MNWKEGIRQIQKEVYDINKANGWHEEGEERHPAEMLLNVISEVVEAWDAYVNNHEITEVYYKTDSNGNEKPEGVPVELGDAVIRLYDIFERYNIDLADIIEEKLEYNKTRGYRHGGKWL